MSVFFYSKDEEPGAIVGPYKAILKKKLEEKYGPLSEDKFLYLLYSQENSDVWDRIAGEEKKNMDDWER